MMGIEQNKYGRPLAYYQQTKTPTERIDYHYNVKAERVPASEMFHIYHEECPSQSRGILWMQTVIWSLQILDQYSESGLVASRIGSSSMGFFKSPTSDGYVGKDKDDPEQL